MKPKAVIVTFILLLLLFPLKTKAEISDAYVLSGADKLESGEYITQDEKQGKTNIDITQKLRNIITVGLSSNIKGALKAVGLMIGLMTVSSVLKNTSFISESKSLGSACELISSAVISAALFSVLFNLFNYTFSCLSALNTYTKSLLPVTTTLYSLAGCVNSAVSSHASFYLFLSFTEIITSDIVMPLLNVGFAFLLVSSLPGGIDLSSICSVLKKTVTVTLSFIFICFGFVISVKSIIAQAADKLALRGLKFASGTFIPIIGNILGDSARTVFASVNVIKSTVGTVGMVSILSLTIPPLIAVFLYKTSFNICTCYAKAISLNSESKMIEGANELLGILSAIIAGCSAIFILICAIFMKAGDIL